MPNASISSLLWMPSSLQTSTSTGKPCVSQPAFAFAAVASHGAVTRKEVLDRSGQAVAGVGHAVGGWRAFEENESRSIFPELERLFVDAILFPKSEGFVFEFWKLDVCLYRLEHDLKSGWRMIMGLQYADPKPAQERVRRSWPQIIDFSSRFGYRRI